MPEKLPSKPKAKLSSEFRVIVFIIILCFVCGLLLAVVAFTLQESQDEAKEFDRNKQMLIAAKILNQEGYFEVLEDQKISPAYFDPEKKRIVPFKEEKIPPKATEEEIKEISKLRIRPLLTDSKGAVTTFEKEGISLPEYLAENKKGGYAPLPLKLFYALLPNDPAIENLSAEDIANDLSKVETLVIPVSGFGLWAPIYGYLAVSNDGDTIIGTTWYEHAETPGLGANITAPWWQKQFYGKLIFQESSNGKTQFNTAPLGIIVVKGKVKDAFGDSPKAKSAVDGISGATSTGDGVTAAYKASLNPYRSLFIRIHELNNSKKAVAKVAFGSKCKDAESVSCKELFLKTCICWSKRCAARSKSISKECV